MFADKIKEILNDFLKILMFDNQNPILIEGETSMGKTRIVTFISKMLG